MYGHALLLLLGCCRPARAPLPLDSPDRRMFRRPLTGEEATYILDRDLSKLWQYFGTAQMPRCRP